MNENTNLIDEHNENLIPVKTLSPFKRMVLSIGTLPSAFYDTMTYYESLVWLYKYLNDTVIPTINNNGEAVEELQDAFITLETFISEYFDNLDVQEEINNKLDEMAENGTLMNLIKRYVDPIYEAYEGRINQTVEDLDERIDLQDEDISAFKTTVNTKLTQQDAQIGAVTSGSPLKATSTSDMTDTSRIYVNTTDGKWYYYDGDSWEIGGTYQSTGIDDSTYPISYIFESLDDLSSNGYLLKTGTFEQGGLGSTSGLPTTSSTLVRSTKIIYGNGKYKITPNGQKYTIFNYDYTGTFTSTNGWYDTTEREITISGGNGFKLMISKSDTATNITPSEVAVTVYKYTSISTLNNEFPKMVDIIMDGEDYICDATFVQGGITTNTGLDYNSNTLLRLTGFLEAGDYILKPNGLKLYEFKYSSSGTYESTGSWGIVNDYHVTIPTGKKYRYTISKLDATANITPSDNTVSVDKPTYLSVIDEKIKKLNYDFPDYYLENVNSAIERFNNNSVSVNDSFIFITDVHTSYNSLHSGGLIKYIVENTNCKKVVFGGDIPPAYDVLASDEKLIEYGYNWLEQIHKFDSIANYYGLKGNHDMMLLTGQGGTEYSLDDEETYNFICGSMKDDVIINQVGKMYYAYKNQRTKVMYIMTDYADLDSTQLEWIANLLLSVDSSWSIIVFNHMSCISNLPGYSAETYELGVMLKDFNNRRNSTYGDFTNAQGEFVAFICGHAHKDTSVVEDNTLFITIGCDARYQDDNINNWTRANGTVSEQLFDIFSVDVLNKKLYATRVGCGGYGDTSNSITSENIYDREWDY